jgi:hypothetical protein
MDKIIPAVWRIDIEPDRFEARQSREPWHGFISVARLVETLRMQLAEQSGYPVRPTWFLRLDPHIEYCYGSVDFVVTQHEALLDRIIALKEPLGIHVHPYRWDRKQQVLFSEHSDQWAIECLNVAAQTFRSCFKVGVRRACMGGYFLTGSILDAAIELGIETDVTAEPGLGPKQNDPSFGEYATAPSSDFSNFPRRPFYPSRERIDTPAFSRAVARRIRLVPLTAYDYGFTLAPRLARAAAAILPIRRRHLPLNPWKAWPGPKAYWDFVMRAADEQSPCYFAFAIRTDDPISQTHNRVREILEFLPRHPIARRLRFVDPLGPEICALAIPAA